MPKKPNDILAFLRSRKGDPEGAAAAAEAPLRAPAPEEPARRPRVFVLRRTQVYVVLVAAALLCVLAFQLGHIAGRRSAPARAPAAAVRLWVIQVITYDATEMGRADAALVVRTLEKAGIGAAVHESGAHLVVIAGAWYRNPKDDPEAQALLGRVRELRDAAGTAHFQDARFWSIER